MTGTTPIRAATPRLMSQVPSKSTTALSSHSQKEVLDGFGPSHGPAQARRSGRPSIDHLSEKATSAFIRRTLCAQQLSGDKGRSSEAPIDELLPPLTSRNDVDLQLYGFLAVILKEFVQTWYSKITPDEAFVCEIVQIIAHCTRALEQRLRKVDLESLLFDELPDLLDRHIVAYRASRSPIARPPTEVDPHDVYHSLCPLPLLSPVPRPSMPETIAEQRENERVYRQLLAEGALAILLPTEDLQNPCLTSLVSQILSELVIGNIIANKASQPWLLYEGLSILAKIIQEERRAKPAGKADAKLVMRNQSGSAAAGFVQSVLLSTLHWMFLIVAAIRFLITSLVLSSSLPSRRGRGPKGKRQLTSRSAKDTSPRRISLDETDVAKVPVVSFRIWTCASNLIEMERRMPWLGASLSLLQLGLLSGPGKIANVDGIMDRFASHLVHRHILDPARLPPLLRALRGALFPSNAPGTPTLFPPSSDAELAALRRKCALALGGLLPAWTMRLYFRGGLFWRSAAAVGTRPWAPRPDDHSVGSSSSGQEQGDPPSGQQAGLQDRNGLESALSPMMQLDEDVIEEIEATVLDVFSDEYCNKHLMYSVLELVLVRLMPELAEKGVEELWDERLS